VNSNAYRPTDFSGFVRAQAARLVDARGIELQLRGVGLGNWLLPEGYMWKFGPGAESPREIEALVTRLLGEDSAEVFWNKFHEAFISEEDIAKISESGFDHVRLPINSRILMTDEGLPIEAGFALIDRVIEWCREHGLWVLLDLHGAPGGQTGTNIDDSPNNKPELFMDRRYWDQTLELWRLLATRYAKETVVLGYDLLNEPLPNEWQYRYLDELSTLYRELTAVIRAVDTNHLIVYEGTHWATNWDLFTEVWDENSLLQFHKYWSAPDTASIQKFLDARDRLGLPIYMGESGENNVEWLYTAFRLYESHDIGWNFWPWKKLDTKTSPLSVMAPSGWDEIREYARGGAIVPRERAQEIFDQLLSNMRVENCTWHPEIVGALLANNLSVIPAWGFGFHGPGQSYSTQSATPLAGMRSEESVTIEYADHEVRDNHNFEQTDGRDYADAEQLVVRLKKGEWLEYEVSPMTDLEGLSVETSDSDSTCVAITPSERGFRLTARQSVGLLRIVRKRGYPCPS
jgi:endoglucanase